MTIRRQWLLVLVLIAVASVVVNSFILSLLTNDKFKDYVKENYDLQYEQIVEYTTNMLKSNDYSVKQMKVELETHLVDPIKRIKVYDAQGDIITDVSVTPSYSNAMMNGKGMMMRGMMKDPQLEEVDHADILDGETVIGQINIIRYSSAETSKAVIKFRSSLFKNSFISVVIVLILSIITGYLISKRISSDLINTANMAQNIDVGNNLTNFYSKVKEIRVIQQSLESARERLKLKQKSRKALVDELIHQTRTPLTILRTHLEGIEDGVIDLSAEEFKICENQIDNITAIITNMSSMIDADRQQDSLHMEKVEFSQILKQIINGMRAQFEKKKIELVVGEYKKVKINTDKYKLSQAIYNILTNAYKFTDTNGKVKIDYQVTSTHVILFIEDDGIGIKEEELDKIFEAYYKGDRVNRDVGDGIGLYISKENIVSINGTIRVTSKINQGSKFSITIPIK